MITEERFERAKKLLAKHGYITKLTKDGDGCKVAYPAARLMDKPPYSQTFSIQREDQPGFWVTTTNHPDKWFIPLPEYAMRLYVACEVASNNVSMGIDPSITAMYDEEGKECEEIEEILSAPTHENDRKKEGFLNGLISEAKDNGFSPEYEEVAKTHGVAEGYATIRKFYTNV